MEDREARRIERALKKKAFGYTVREKISEYAIEDRRAVEVKRRVHAKHVPGDLAALKLLLERERETELSEMSEEELGREFERLLARLGACVPEGSAGTASRE